MGRHCSGARARRAHTAPTPLQIPVQSPVGRAGGSRTHSRAGVRRRQWRPGGGEPRLRVALLMRRHARRTGARRRSRPAPRHSKG